MALKSYTANAKIPGQITRNGERVGKMRALKLVLVAILVTSFITFGYIACTGGGGGDDDDDTPTYTPAEIDQENVDTAIEFVDDVLPFCSLNSTVSSSMTALISAVDLAQDYNDQVKLYRVSNRRIQPQGEDDDLVLDGNCGGTLIVSLTQNDATGEIDGSAVFENLCLEVDGDTEPTQLTADGTIQVSGSTQAIDAENDNTELTFSTTGEGITLTDGETDYSIVLDEAELSITEGNNGINLGLTLTELVFVESSPDATDTYTLQNVSMGLNTTDLGNDESQVTLSIAGMTLQEETPDGTTTYSLDDVTIVLTDNAGGNLVSLSGTYIDSQVGAVTVSTPTQIVINDQGVITNGTLIIAGSNGTDAIIQVSDDNSFDIQADTNGDGVYDYEPGEMDCSDFDADSLL